MPNASTDDWLQLDNQFCFALYSASHALTKTYKPFLDKLGLTYPQYLAMLVLWEHDDVPVKTLGQRLYLDSGTLTPLLKRMEDAGLVHRVRDQVDERMVKIQLSKEGRALKRKAQEIPLQILCASGQTPELLAQMRQQLADLRTSLLSHESIE